MRRSLTMKVLVPALILATMVFWFGCQQKGDLSPTGSNRSTLTYIDTVIVDPPILEPGATALLEARILTETSEPAVGEDVRFSVTRGMLQGAHADTTIRSDSLGRARTTYTAPNDTGAVLVRTELLSMSEMRTTSLHVTTEGAATEGLLSLWADFDSLFADNGSSYTRVYARLRNEAHNPIGGATVTFSTTLGTITSPAVTEEITGVATATLVSSTEAGEAVVIARSGASSDTLHIVFLTPTPASQVIVSSSQPQITAGTGSTDITARVFDLDNLPIADNTIVFFSTTRGTLTALTAQTMGGVASTTLLAPSTTGEAVISATTGNQVSGSVSLQVTPGPVASISLTSGVSEMFADNISTTTITAALTDNFNNGVAEGTPVTFSAVGGVVTASGTVGPNGQATASFRAGRDVGPATIIAMSNSVQGSVSIQMLATPATSISLTANPLNLIANGTSQSQLRALVLDANNSPVSNGTLVTFTSDFGVISDGGSGGPNSHRGGYDHKAVGAWSIALKRESGDGHSQSNVKQKSVSKLNNPATSTFTTTTLDGYADATLTSPTLVNSDDITATTGNLSDGETVIYSAGAPALIQVNPAEDNLPADSVSTTTVTCVVTDAFGNSVGSGVAINATATLGTLIPTSGYTDPNGVFVTTLVTSRQRGVCAIIVNADGASGYGQVIFTVPEVTSVTLAADHSSMLADGISSAMLTALAVDDNSLPVGGVAVSWQASPGIGSLVPLSSVTNAQGMASAIYYSGASTIDATQDVTVTIGGHSDTRQMRLLGVSMSAWPDNEQLPADGASTTPVNVHVRETTSGMAIPNATVRFAASNGSIPQTAVTNASGLAIAAYQSSNVPGTADISCLYGDTLRAETSVHLTNTEADTVMATVAQNDLLADGLSTTLVTAYVVNEGMQGVPNTPVTFTVAGPGWITPEVVNTNANGIAVATYHSAASTSDQIATVNVAIDRTEENKQITLRGVMVDVTVDESMIPANGVTTTSVRGHVRETTSLVAVANVPVTFGTSLGSVVGSALTDESGIAVVDFTAGTTEGMATIICRYGPSLGDTTTLQLYTPAAQTITVSPGASSLRADGVATLNISATVLDDAGVPLANAPVSWTVTIGTVQFAQPTTSSSGIATMIYQSAASVNDVPATISITCGAVMQSTTVMNRGVTVDVTATPAIVIADGNSTSQIRAHVFETSSNVAVSEENVSFGTTLGSIPNMAQTNASGLATVLLTSSTTTGIATVTALVGGGLSDQVQVTFAPSTPTTLSLTAAPTVLLADNISTSNLTAVVTDQNGNPVPNGTQVRFSLPPQSGSLENLRTTVGGVASNVLTSSTTPGTLTIVAWAELNPEARDSVQVTYVVGPAAFVNLTAQSDTLQANGIAVDSVTAHVTDAVGHSLSNVEVLFTTTVGNITASRVTNSSGDARVAFTSPQTGTALITATAGTAVGYYTIYLIPGTPNSIQMEYFPNSVGVRGSGRNETLLITATVRDANNNTVIDGTPVHFNINNSPGGGDFLSSTGAIPTINGQATVSYNSGTVSGSVRIRAHCGAVTAVSTEILIYAGPPYIEDISSGCATSHMSLAPSPCSMFGMDFVGDSVTLLALVGDRYNNPVTPGTAVYFTTSAGVVTTATGYTDSSGFARVTLYSGNPLPTVDRWLNTLSDPNIGGAILCNTTPTQSGMAKIMASSAGVDANGDSVTVWATTDVIFDYRQPQLLLRSASVNGDPEERELFIGQNALIRIATYDPDFWPLVYGSTITFSASKGTVYPSQITVGCPGDTTYSVSFFNDLTVNDDDTATPVLISVDTRQGDAFAFTETFTLRAALPGGP